MKKFFVIFIFIYIFPCVFALGISPAKLEVDFSPNIQRDLTINVINNEGKSLDVAVYAEGPLSSYVRFPSSTMHINPDEYSKPLIFSITLPDRIDKPGSHEVLVTVKEIEKAVEGEPISIGSSLSVISLLKVNVPYPGKYADVNLFISDAEPGTETIFAVEVNNLGKDRIQSAKASISIINPNGERIALVDTDEKSIDSMTKRELIAKWVPEDIGSYKAVAVVYYDGEQASVTKEFFVGNFFLKLLSITVKNFKLGGIAKFDILLQNIGNEVIMQAYSKMFLDEANKRIMDIESNRIDLNPEETKVMNSYWDTEGIAKGIYYGIIRLVYSDKSSEKRIKMTVKERSIDTEIITGMAVASAPTKIKTSSIVSVIVISVIVAALFLFFHFRKKKKK